MKICVHIVNESVHFDPEVMVMVECDGVPRTGDEFYLRKEKQRNLEEQAMRAGYYEQWQYGQIVSFFEAVCVVRVAWIKDDGVYRCHIELGDDEQ